MKSLFGLINLLIYVNFTIAQSHNVILKLTDFQSHEPIGYAVGFLQINEHVGGVSDAKGVLNLNLSDSQSEDELVLAALGYRELKVDVAELLQQSDTIFLEMKRQSILLDDVLVEAKGYDLMSIVVGAYQSIREHVPGKKHQLEGLFRQTATKGDEFTKLREAIVILQDYDYQLDPGQVKIKVENLRESMEWAEMDSLLLQILEVKYPDYNTIGNKITSLYSSNAMRLYNQKSSVFSYSALMKTKQYYDLELMNVEVVEGDTIVQIAHGVKGQFVPSPANYWKINLADQALVEYKITHFGKDGRLLSSQFGSHQKSDGAYYPKHFKKLYSRYVNRNHEDVEMVKEDFWFANIKYNKLKKIKETEKLKSKQKKIWLASAEYDSAFWVNHPMLIRYPVPKPVIESLNRRMPVIEQFKEMHSSNFGRR